MSDEQLERLLRSALRRQDPGGSFTEQLLARLPAEPCTRAEVSAGLRRWLPIALAACVLAGVGLGYRSVQQHQRARHANLELLQALTITSAYVNAVRGAVLREENESPP